MPEPATLGLFALAAAALIAVPGPNLIYIAARSASEGRRAGLASVLGVETGTVVFTIATAAGLAALLASSAVAYDVVRYAGAAYLVGLGLRRLRSPEALDEDAPAPASAPWRAYRQGLAVQLLNPKVALFFLAFVPQFTDPARGSVALQILVLGGVLSVLGACISSLYALGAAAVAARMQRSGAGRGRISGAIYVVLGAAAAIGGGGHAS